MGEREYCLNSYFLIILLESLRLIIFILIKCIEISLALFDNIDKTGIKYNTNFYHSVDLKIVSTNRFENDKRFSA